jgi:hypothetical protein
MVCSKVHCAGPIRAGCAESNMRPARRKGQAHRTARSTELWRQSNFARTKKIGGARRAAGFIGALFEFYLDT